MIIKQQSRLGISEKASISTPAQAFQCNQLTDETDRAFQSIGRLDFKVKVGLVWESKGSRYKCLFCEEIELASLVSNCLAKPVIRYNHFKKHMSTEDNIHEVFFPYDESLTLFTLSK